MYSFIWRRLPGGRVSRTVELTLLLAAVATLLWLLLFPWAALYLPIDQAGIG